MQTHVLNNFSRRLKFMTGVDSRMECSKRKVTKMAGTSVTVIGRSYRIAIAVPEWFHSNRGWHVQARMNEDGGVEVVFTRQVTNAMN